MGKQTRLILKIQIIMKTIFFDVVRLFDLLKCKWDYITLSKLKNDLLDNASLYHSF